MLCDLGQVTLLFLIFRVWLHEMGLWIPILNRSEWITVGTWTFKTGALSAGVLQPLVPLLGH